MLTTSKNRKIAASRRAEARATLNRTAPIAVARRTEIGLGMSRKTSTHVGDHGFDVTLQKLDQALQGRRFFESLGAENERNHMRVDLAVRTSMKTTSVSTHSHKNLTMKWFTLKISRSRSIGRSSFTLLEEKLSHAVQPTRYMNGPAVHESDIFDIVRNYFSCGAAQFKMAPDDCSDANRSHF